MQCLVPRHLLGTFIVLTAILTTTSIVCGNTKKHALTESHIHFTENKTLQIQTDKAQLTAGQPLDRELKAGETHDYLIPLKAGEYAHVSIAQLNIDVSYTLYDPHGKTIATINWEDQGAPESLWLGAEESGDYRLAITGETVKGANAHYIATLAKVGELKTAPSADQTYVRAYQLFFQAEALSDQKDNESIRKAAEAYEQALPLWRAVKDRIGEAITLDGLGFVLSSLGENDKAIESYKQAIEIWHSSNNHQREEANSLHDLALTGLSFTDDLDALKKERELRHLLGDPKGEALALSNMGSACYQQADFQATLAYFQEALTLGRASGDKATEARILSNIGAVYFSLGEFQRAFDYSKQVLPLRRAAGDRRGESITLTNLGSIYRELGEPQRSLEYYRQALPLIQQVGDRSTEASVLDALGLSYYALGDYSKALEYHQQSLSLRRELKDKSGQGSALNNIASAYAGIGERAKALDYFEQALQLRRVAGDRRGEILTLQSAGELYRASGETAKARAYFEQGLDLSRSIKNRFFEAQSLYGLARIEQSAGHLVEARSQVERAIDIIEFTRARVNSTDLRASFLAIKQNFYELEIDLLMQSYLRDHTAESLTKAFSVSEGKRARSLLDSLVETQSNIRAGVSPELLDREHRLQQELNVKAERQVRLLGQKHTDEQAATISREIEQLTTDYEQVLSQIRQSSPRYAALTQPTPLSLEQVQTQVLDSDSVLLEYSLGEERSYLWTVTNNSVRAYELPGRNKVEELGRRVYGLLTARNQLVKFETVGARRTRISQADDQYFPAAQSLSEMLLGPARAQLKNKRLLIVADGMLEYLPFGALPTVEVRSSPAHWTPLLLNHEIVSLPSASTISVLRREIAGRPPAPKIVAVLADPVFQADDSRVKADPDKEERKTLQGSESVEENVGLRLLLRDAGEMEFRRLPFSRQEADGVVAFASKSLKKESLDFEASRATAISGELSDYRIIHLATHTFLDSRNPELSGVVFSLVDPAGKPQNGFLRLNEIYNLKLNADLVVLSGCRTALGKEVRGEGLIGLTRGFMYAGAPRVLASLWSVDDESTATLMKSFYRELLLKKRTPAAALRSAQASVWRDSKLPPYYWAAFVLQGEWK